MVSSKSLFLSAYGFFAIIKIFVVLVLLTFWILQYTSVQKEDTNRLLSWWYLYYYDQQIDNDVAERNTVALDKSLELHSEVFIDENHIRWNIFYQKNRHPYFFREYFYTNNDVYAFGKLLSWAKPDFHYILGDFSWDQEAEILYFWSEKIEKNPFSEYNASPLLYKATENTFLISDWLCFIMAGFISTEKKLIEDNLEQIQQIISFPINGSPTTLYITYTISKNENTLCKENL